MSYPQKYIQVEVSRAAFGNNIRLLRKLFTPAKLCVVMKSNAYGHGLDGLLNTALNAGADYIGICTNNEADVIRRRHPGHPLLRLRMALADELEESVERFDIEEMVGSPEVAQFLARLGRRRGRPVPVHVKIDTGMGRTGFLSNDRTGILSVCDMKGLAVRGVMTHLPSADAPNLDPTLDQLAEFNALVARLANAVDVTDIEGTVRWGHEAVLVGRQDDEEITFEEVANLFDSVHTEINLMAGNFNKPRYVD